MSRPATKATPAVHAASSNVQIGCAGLLVRLYWLAVGNLALLGTAVLIARRAALSAADLFFWAAAGSLVFVRYLDVSCLHGLTAEGQPATVGHWRRYAVVLLLAAAALWISAHALGRWLASR